MQTRTIITPPLKKLIDAGKIWFEEEEGRWACGTAEALHVLIEEQRKQGWTIDVCPCPVCRHIKN